MSSAGRVRNGDPGDLRSAGRPARSPTRSPAWVPPVAVGRTTTSGPIPAPRPGRRARGRRGSSRRRRSARTRRRDDVRPVAGRAQIRHDPLHDRLRSPRSAVAGRWMTAPSSSSRRAPGRARRAAARTGRGGRRGRPSPRPPPSAGQWLDQRRPVVTRRVGALREGRPDQELEVAQLVAAEGEREQVLALDPDAPRLRRARRETRERCGAETARRRARSAGRSVARPGMVRSDSRRRLPVPSPPDQRSIGWPPASRPPSD